MLVPVRLPTARSRVMRGWLPATYWDRLPATEPGPRYTSMPIFGLF